MTGARPGKSRVHAVLLAAGASSRYGNDNKLLAEIERNPLVRRVAQQVLASRAASVTAVTGHEEARVRAALSGLGVEFAHNADFAHGLASSLKCGLRALPEEAGGAMIVLGDMPGVTPALIDDLIAAFETQGGEKIVFPVSGEGLQGNPVIWPSRFFGALRELEGDRGAKPLIAEHMEETLGMPVEDASAFGDIDFPEDLAGWRGQD